MAEGVGFEPTIRFPVYTLSRRAPSTTRPPLRMRVRGAEHIEEWPGGQYGVGEQIDSCEHFFNDHADRSILT